MFILVRPVGLSCQLACKYCYYKAGHENLKSAQAGRMDLSIIDKLLEGLLRLPEKYNTICLHGGEPLLVGKRWFGEFVNKILKFNESNLEKKLSIAIQTNGIDIDEEWIDLFKRGSVGISLSLDGPKGIHDSARLDRKGYGTFDQIIDTIGKLKSSNFSPSIISVLTKNSLKLSPNKYYVFFSDLGIKEMDIAPYIETGNSEMEVLARNSYEPDVSDLTLFLNTLFDVWLYHSKTDGFVNIRSFEQTVGALLGYTPTLCNRKAGIACGRTPCIMPDGSVFACDLETDGIDLKLGSLRNENFEDIVKVERLQKLHNYVKQAFKELGCYNCGFLGVCAFACPRFAFSKRNLSAYCTFTKGFVEHVKSRLNDISEELFSDKIEFTSFGWNSS